MKNRVIKKLLCSVLAFGMIVPNAFPVYAEEAAKTDLTAELKDYWNFDSLTSNQGEKTTATVHGNANIVESGDKTFGKVLRFGGGADNYLRLDNYINTGSGSTSFSMWYRYDTTITGDDANKATVLLQHEGEGRSLLTLQGDGKYNTFINKQNVTSKNVVEKGQWQHIVVTFDQSAKKVKYYINGEKDSEQALGNEVVNKVLPLRLGAHKTPGTTDPHAMRGDVDEFRVYNKALTDAEAKALYDEKAPKVDDVKLTVDLNKVNQTIEPETIFGINHRYAFNGYGTFDSEKMKIKDDFKSLYEQAGFGSIRYPGGTISNLFNWKTTLGSKENRKKQIHGFYNNQNQNGIEPNFGIKEIGDFADEVNSEIVYVYSLGRGNAMDAADLVEYLNAKVGTNPNGGIDWAQVRAKNGHKDPYNVRYFEIGNEMQQAYGKDADGTTSQGYWTQYVEGGAEKAYTEGGVAKFVQRYAVDEENWNKVASRTDGKPNLVRYLRYANVNPGKMENGKIVADPEFKAVNDGVQVYVGVDGKLTEWKVVNSFENSKENDTHCVVDYSTGAIHFGDGKHGKIPEANQNVYATYSVKREGFIDVSKAIKNTTNKINEIEGTKHKANVYTSYESKGFIQHMNDLHANDWYDGMTIHPYSGTVQGNTAEAFYDDAMKKAETKGVDHVKDYVKMLPEGKVPVISEYGIFRNTQPQVRSQTHAVYIAKVLMEYVKLGSPYIQKHCLADWYSSGGDSLGPTQQAVIQVVPQTNANTGTGEGEFKFFSTPSARVFEMLNGGFGEKVVDAQFDVVPTMSNGVKMLSALASKDNSGNIYVAMVNVDRKNDRNVVLNIPNYNLAGHKIELQTLSSKTITDENTLANPETVKVNRTNMVATETQSITVPKHSFVVAKICSNVNKTALQKKVDEINTLNKANYTNFASVETVLNKAKTVLENSSATQDEVDRMLKELTDAQAKLTLKKANYAKVDEAIKKANALNKDDFVDFSEVEKALNAVVRDLDITKQAEVDGMAKAIEEAIKGLTNKPAPKPEKPSKEALENALMEAKKLNGKDYKEDGWKVFVNALEVAQSVYENEDATEQEIADAVKQLKDAQNKLVKVEVEKPEETQKPQKPDKKPNNEQHDKTDTTSKPVKTGDTAPILPLMIMGLGAVLVVLKKH
ncbi:LamG-like jellyroll fold domain-containing protein [Faecalimonas sp.]